MPRIKHSDPSDPANDLCADRQCRHARGRHPNGPCIGRRYNPLADPVACKCTAFVEPRRRKTADIPGDIVSMHMRWVGDPPVVGDYLISQGKARNAYQIVELHQVRETLEIRARRFPAGDLPAGVEPHPIKWNSRSRKNDRNMLGVGWS